MEVEVIPKRVKPETVKKLQADVTHNKQDTDTDNLTATEELAAIRKTLTELDKRITLLEQP